MEGINFTTSLYLGIPSGREYNQPKYKEGEYVLIKPINQIGTVMYNVGFTYKIALIDIVRSQGGYHKKPYQLEFEEAELKPLDKSP